MNRIATLLEFVADDGAPIVRRRPAAGDADIAPGHSRRLGFLVGGTVRDNEAGTSARSAVS
jgi:hypothetical protein